MRFAVWIMCCMVLVACKPNQNPGAELDLNPVSAPLIVVPKGDQTLAWAVDGAWRDKDKARDAWRHPKETLEFFRLKPGATVVEVWPGGGWYTQILAPYLARTHGQLIVAHFDPRTTAANPFVSGTLAGYEAIFLKNPELYGTITMSALGPDTGPIAPDESADLVVTFRNVHNWMNAEYAQKAFKDMYDVLKPGGYLGVEEHRGNARKPQDPFAVDGYVREYTVKQMAKEAGFKFVESSEINANPKDTKDHPFGVWTLPPVRRSAPVGKPADPAFDHAKYDAIGESDRMTLLFRKPKK